MKLTANVLHIQIFRTFSVAIQTRDMRINFENCNISGMNKYGLHFCMKLIQDTQLLLLPEVKSPGFTSNA